MPTVGLSEGFNIRWFGNRGTGQLERFFPEGITISVGICLPRTQLGGELPI